MESCARKSPRRCASASIRSFFHIVLIATRTLGQTLPGDSAEIERRHLLSSVAVSVQLFARSQRACTIRY
jgi:hypothetical protein